MARRRRRAPVCFFPKVKHAVPETGKILLSLAVVAAGYALAISFCLAFYKRRDKRLVGLTERSRLATAGYTFLVNKYYLDYLYENIIVRAVAYPISRRRPDQPARNRRHGERCR